MRRTNRGFTLVEILVVIGIIAVLVGILVPALGAARESANTSYCANNLRRLQIACMAYATDRENYLPPAHYFLVTRNLHRWHGTRTSKTQAFTFTNSPLRPYLEATALKQCPNFQFPAIGFEKSAGGYGYNAQYLGSSLIMAATPMTPLKLDSDFGNRPAKVSMIRKPAETVMFADVAMANPALIEYSFVEPPLLSNDQPSSPSIHFRHRGLANVVWMDGHVTSEKMAWTYPSNVYEADNNRMKLGFFGPKDNTLFDRQ